MIEPEPLVPSTFDLTQLDDLIAEIGDARVLAALMLLQRFLHTTHK